MFRIIDKEFHKNEYGKEKYLKNWPMVYILENGKEAYIGQSTSVRSRMLQHKVNVEKQMFTDVHFIYSSEFNQSVTFDYESKLIQLLSADEKFILTNRNDGIAEKDYYNKTYYDENFKKLWNRLREKKLVQHTIDELINSDLFKYSPYKELNESQRQAVEEILCSIETNDNQPIIVNGMPGSGKTIVAIFLFKYLRDRCDKKIAIVIPQTSLRKTIKELFKHIYGLKASDVIGPSDVVKQKYDIVLVDEAHRLKQRKNLSNYGSHDNNNRKLGLGKDGTELDWILRQVKCPILFYDKAQIVGPSGISKDILSSKINTMYKNRMVTYYTLMTQMRVKGGNGYIDYVQKLLKNQCCHKEEFDTYDFKIVNSFTKFERLLIEKEKETGLARMVAGYAWPWISKKDKTKKDITIEQSERMWNNRTEGWVNCDTSIDEVGCIHSIQGYDLNYAFVILGNDIQFDQQTKQIMINKSNYYDKNGKNTATDAELLEYIKNIYYVLMTRGIEGTYLYICNPELKEYFSKFIDVV